MIDASATASLLHLQGQILEEVARGEPMATIADHICASAERLAEGVICSILTVDAQGRLHPLSGPSLPDAYSQALDGMPMGPEAGSCGTAAYRGEPVEVVDIENDPLWTSYRALALPIGLRACWSSPIKTHEGVVVGTFAFYYREPRGPSELEREIVERCVHLCAIAIAHEETQARINQLAYYDTLTGLPNRSEFLRLAQQALAALPSGCVLNIHYVDLDDFKSVNDLHGHRIGDLLLEQVARRLAACVGANAFAARLSGDEFAVVQTCEEGGRDGSTLARQIVATLAESFEVEDARVNIGASVGIAQTRSGAMPLTELFKRADLALYAAKNDGGHTHRFFAPEMEAAVQLRLSLKQELRGALDRGEFSLVYQPIVALETNALIGVEALLRWRHPSHGDVSPGVFVPIVEEMGLIGPLGAWVLREACLAASRWPRPIKIGVNLSPLQMRKPGLVHEIVTALREAGLAPERLDLEVTESALLARDVATRTALHELHDYGVRLSLDDFGTGYSSLQLLRLFPFDRIKIDMSFVRDIGMDADSMAIVDAVIGLAGELGLRVAAEGVETESQFDWLLRHRCTEGQGYWFSEPLDGEELQALLERMRSDEEAILPRPLQAPSSFELAAR
ncbi:EAL domain-containing protein [Dokdonella sp.]|uniref:putative bifunctional diguanylate cyclase/phosphodiesterase n=1 Tax=Dokdonella sp. TaxID=2291710 RepID=UPI001B1EAEBA|nr:EAL domain-containing protein [Dokdonella sp.]MBO9661474.1 EAL domain-containing protein [Dokdonella sp.]